MKLGATDLIDVTSEKEINANQGRFDFIINTSPSTKGFNDLIGMTAKAGYFVQVGSPDHSENLFSVSSGNIVPKEVTFVGSLVGSRKDIDSMLKLCAEKKYISN